MLIVEQPRQLRALGDSLRGRLVMLLRERAASTTELAEALGLPKGTVGHHLKVLEQADLIRVVRTRKVRALTERYYGRVARLFVLRSDDELPEDLRGGMMSAMMLRQAADEVIASGAEQDMSALVHVRIAPRDVRRFQKRLNRLVADFQDAEGEDEGEGGEAEGERHALALALFRAPTGLPARSSRENGA